MPEKRDTDAVPPASSLPRGHAIHLGGPWYLIKSPDHGRVYFAEDYGPGTREIPVAYVPLAVYEKAHRRAR